MVDDTQFLENVTLSFHLDPADLPALSKKLADQSSGRFSLVEQGQAFYPFDLE